jgi:hypothetical protein
MTKSSYAVALLLAGWGAGAAAEPPGPGPLTADEAMKHYRETFGAEGGAPAPAGCADRGLVTDEEIVVCGRTSRRQLHRLPLPIEREPGEVVRHINEPGGGPDAMAGGACIHSCYQPVSIDLIRAARAMPGIVRHILGKDD